MGFRFSWLGRVCDFYGGRWGGLGEAVVRWSVIFRAVCGGANFSQESGSGVLCYAKNFSRPRIQFKRDRRLL